VDVTEPEPLPEAHPIQEHVGNGLIITPHIGSASLQTRNKTARMATENLIAGLENEPLPNSALVDSSNEA
jgi:glyoxylate reductase